MRVLVVGSGGREHAVAWRLAKSPKVERVYCAPGNAGTAAIAENVEISPANSGALALWALENHIDLTVVGPEAPLSCGIVNVFEQHGLRIFGPTKEAAQLESSKSFAKDVMLAAGVPTPAGAVFTDVEQARAYLRAQGAPIVVKADGLAAGKGVVVAQTLDEALDAVDRFMVQAEFGASGAKVVIEECITGEEASVMALIDGDTVLPLVVSQDYKRVFEGQTGPNTGGMGSISPTPVLAQRRVENLVGDIFLPVIKELSRRGICYRGFLYAGVIVDRAGAVRVLEFNCRLGDPETQVLMARLQSDFAEALDAAVRGRLSSIELRWQTQAAVCVVLASRGYPGKVDDGKAIEGLFPDEENLFVFHAGTRVNPENAAQPLTKGGRILGVTALGENIAAAVKRAYEGVERIKFDGMHYRKDIGAEKA